MPGQGPLWCGVGLRDGGEGVPGLGVVELPLDAALLVSALPAPEPEAPREADIDTRLDRLLDTHSLRDAVARLAAETGIPRRSLYDRALARQRKASCE